MAASTIVVDTKSTEELQKSFGEILDENVILKETLKQNNESLKEQFLLIASCQNDMLKTHQLHQEKFLETKELVERVRRISLFDVLFFFCCYLGKIQAQTDFSCCSIRR